MVMEETSKKNKKRERQTDMYGNVINGSSKSSKKKKKRKNLYELENEEYSVEPVAFFSHNQSDEYYDSGHRRVYKSDSE